MTMIIPRLATTALIAVAAIGTMRVGSAAPIHPTGTWITEDGRARVRTERCGPRDRHLCGYIVWIREAATDSKNPDRRKRGRPVLGHQMILGLEPGRDGRHVGKIYNADDGQPYDVTVWSKNTDELSVEGCMFAVLCGTQTWKRATDILPGQLAASTDQPNGPRADPEWAPLHPATARRAAPD